MSEQDLELLEMLLDGELSDEHADELRRRIGQDPQMAQAMDRLRGEREVRQQIWRGLEPQEHELATLVSRVRGEIRRDQAWSRRARTLRYVSGLAACIVIGFIFGRFLPYGPNGSKPDRGSGVVFDVGPGPVQEVSDDRSTFNARPRPGEFKVLLTDSLDRVIAEQRFNTLDEAREFTDDLNRLQNRTRPMRVSDTIFRKDQF